MEALRFTPAECINEDFTTYQEVRLKTDYIRRFDWELRAGVGVDGGQIETVLLGFEIKRVRSSTIPSALFYYETFWNDNKKLIK